MKKVDKRINKILEILLKYMQKDFSHTIPISGKGDELDALAAGLNTMAEELQAYMTERKKHEKRLKKSHELFSNLFEHNPASLAISRISDGKVMNVNESFLRVFGFSSKEEVIGKTVAELNIWVEPKQRDEIMRLLKEDNKVLNLEGQIRTPQGDIKWASSSVLIIEVDNQPCLLAVTLDITDRKKAEEQVKKMNAELEQEVIARTGEVVKTEKRFRALIENSSDGIGMLNEKGEVIYVSPSASKIDGFTSDELIGKVGIGQVHPEDIPRVMKLLEEVSKNPGKPMYSQHRILHKNGHWVWTEGTMTNFLHDSAINALVANFRDITERKKAEEAVKEREQRLLSIYDTTADIIFVLEVEKNERYRFSSVNKSFQTTTGIPYEAVVGKYVNEIIPQPSLDLVLGKYKEAIQETKIVRWEETSQYPTGLLTGEVGVAPVFDEAGNCVRLVGAVHDITERKKAETEIKKLNEELEQKVIERTAQLESVNKELEAFSYSVSHDLRAPLRHIGGFVQIMRKNIASQLDEKSQRHLNIISEASDQMGRLIDDLLVFSRMGRAEMMSSTVKLESLVHEVKRELTLQNESAKVDWLIDPLPAVKGDPSMLRMVFVNLLSNAIKYSRSQANPRIEVVACPPENGQYVFAVKDNGVGFDMNYAHKLFGVFQRLHSSDQFEGTGIGLATVRRIIQRHGGRTWAEGKPGEGATFYCSLPTT